ncbi:hypothetical protein [Bartonella sp. AS69XJJH]
MAQKSNASACKPFKDMPQRMALERLLGVDVVGGVLSGVLWGAF